MMVDGYNVTEHDQVQVGLNLITFKKASMFQSSIVAFMSGLLQKNDEVQRLSKIFLKVDTSKDGYISVNEIETSMQEFEGDFTAIFGRDTNWKNVMDSLDADKDGKLDFNEFLAAASDRVTLLNDENLKKAFSILDKNDDGKVSA